MNNVSLFKYITGNSKIHTMSSKYKIAYFLLSLIIIILLNDKISILLFGLLTLYMMSETKINIKQYFYNLLVLWPLYIIAGVISFLLTFNIITCIIVLYKLVMIIITFLILTFTTSLSEIAWGFECLFKRLKSINFPVSKMALNIALSIKFISTMFDQGRAIRKSMAYRGVPYNKKHHKAFKNMLIPVMSLSLKLSKRMVAAMKLRFYGYSTNRTNYRGNKVTNFDKVIIFCEFAIIYLALWLGWYRWDIR